MNRPRWQWNWRFRCWLRYYLAADTVVWAVWLPTAGTWLVRDMEGDKARSAGVRTELLP